MTVAAERLDIQPEAWPGDGREAATALVCAILESADDALARDVLRVVMQLVLDRTAPTPGRARGDAKPPVYPGAWRPGTGRESSPP